MLMIKVDIAECLVHHQTQLGVGEQVQSGSKRKWME
jgi:hypothetical protein